MCSIAVDEGVLADHGAVADGEQVGADGHVRGKDHHAAPDLRAQRPQIERKQRRTGEKDDRVRRTNVLTIQKRTYARLQMRISRGFHRPISTHLARMGSDKQQENSAPPETTDRR